MKQKSNEIHSHALFHFIEKKTPHYSILEFARLVVVKVFALVSSKCCLDTVSVNDITDVGDASLFIIIFLSFVIGTCE
jgi:hypothetical protein